MKTFYRYLLLCLVVVSATIAAKAENPKDVTLFFEQCSQRSAFQTVLVNKELLKMVDNVDFGVEGINGLLGKIETIGIVTTEKKNDVPKLVSLTDEFFPSGFEKGRYKILMSVNEDGENTKILQSVVQWYGLNTFVIITREPSEMTVVVIYGSLTMADVSKLKL